ncbi:MAG: STAS domain-containing protein [Gammaproteobacteria bacterium]|nr:STAS domain-containing protein [Gammaproteobacteria bacterium]
MKMEIADRADGLVNVTLTGRLDTPAVQRVEPDLVASLVPRGARAIVDLSRLEFVGSTGMRMFIAIARDLARKNGKLVLYSPQPWVNVMFTTAALQSIVSVCPDVASAAVAART